MPTYDEKLKEEVAAKIADALAKLTAALQAVGAEVITPEMSWQQEEHRLIKYEGRSLSIRIFGERPIRQRYSGRIRIEYTGADRRQNRVQPTAGWDYENLARGLLQEMVRSREKYQAWERSRKAADILRSQADEVEVAIKNYGPTLGNLHPQCKPNHPHSLDLQFLWLTKEQALGILAVLNAYIGEISMEERADDLP